MQSKLLIIEDHPLYAEALQSAIVNALRPVETEHVQTIADAAERLRKKDQPVNLAILDLRLPDSNGFEGLIALRSLAPAMPILIMSAFAEPATIRTALVCGAAGFIAKATPKQSLIAAIRDVLNGKKPLLSNGDGSDGAGDGFRPITRCGALTRQQIRVLHMLNKGLLNKQIAHTLGINESTVKAHVSEIFRKLRVSSRTQAVVAISTLAAPTMFSSVYN